MRAYILKESESELRVSASPDSVKKMVELGIAVNIQTTCLLYTSDAADE